MTKEKIKKSRTSQTGEKFASKYKVEATQIYKGDPGADTLLIPPPGHFLYDAAAPTVFDEIKVKQIDADGHMTDAIEVWTDPDVNKMFVVDGRDRLLAVREVNHRRALAGKELVKPHLKPLGKLSQKEVIARITIKNFHRRPPTPSAYAMHIANQRRAGWDWETVAHHLHITTDDAEQWCKKRLPLAFCEPEVCEAFDAGEFPLSAAPAFGGRNVEGVDALGRKQQLDLLTKRRQEKLAGKDESKPRQVSPKVRERVRAALMNGESANLCHQDKMIAEGVAAALAFVNGDEGALNKWPDIAAIVRMVAEKKQEKQEKQS